MAEREIGKGEEEKKVVGKLHAFDYHFKEILSFFFFLNIHIF